MAFIRRQTLILIVLAAIGCNRPTTSASPRVPAVWTFGGGGFIPAYENFYESSDEYPSYAIATYHIDERYSARKDAKHFANAIRLCRSDFGDSWRAGAIERYDNRTSRRVPLRPSFVVVAIRNLADHKGESTFAGSYRVAWLLPAGDLFDETKSAKELLKQAVMDRQPFANNPPPDPRRRIPSVEYTFQWRIIERHMSTTTLQTQPGGSQPTDAEDRTDVAPEPL